MSRPEDDGFMTRWSRRKAQVRRGGAVPAEPSLAAAAPVPASTRAAMPASTALTGAPSDEAGAAPGESHPAGGATAQAAPPAAPVPPPPTLEDVARLDAGSDFRRFVAPEVDASVKNAALKKLFADPHFNVMDGLDTYIDDYGQAEPLPRSMLRQMVQARTLGLLDDEVEDQRPAADSVLGPPGDAPQATVHGPAPSSEPACPPEPTPTPTPAQAPELPSPSTRPA